MTGTRAARPIVRPIRGDACSSVPPLPPPTSPRGLEFSYHDGVTKATKFVGSTKGLFLSAQTKSPSVTLEQNGLLLSL